MGSVDSGPPASSVPPFARWLGAYAALAGAVSLAGWLFDVPILARWGPGDIAIQPNTALAGLLAGVALLAMSAGVLRGATVLGAGTALIGGATLFQHVTGFDLGIDRLLLFDRTWGAAATLRPGRMGIPASVCYTLLGVGLVSASRPTAIRAVAPVLGLIASAIALLSLVGYVYGVDRFYALPKLTAIAFQTSTLLFAVGLGLVAAVHDRAPGSAFASRTGAGHFLRTFLPFAIVVPVVVGWLALTGQRASWYEGAFGTALGVVIEIGMFSALLLWAGRSIAVRERGLVRTNERLEDLLSSVSDLFHLVDADWRITYVNAALRRTLAAHGIDPLAVSGRKLFDVFPTLHDGAAGDELRRAHRDRVHVAFETYFEPWQKWFDVRVSPTPDGGLAVLSQDVTLRRDTEAARESMLEREQAARRAAERANRTKDEFLATLSHELRTPLNAILGWSQILSRKPLDESLVDRGLTVIERNARLQAQLVSDLLDMSRIASGKLRLELALVEPTAVVRAALESIRPVAEANGVRLVSALPIDCAPVRADAARVEQIIWNLLSNAVKFTPRGGEVRVVLTCRDEDIEIEVTDTGRGMSAEFLRLVFERFRQADGSTTRAYGGLGIGLAIVKELVELHGGRVRATSPGEGLGSTFTVTLPVAPGAIDTDTSAPRRLDGARAELDGVQLLVVDDDPDSLDLLRRLLEECGAEVLAAANANEALANLARARVELVVSDIGMPNVDGYELLRRAREAGYAGPAIALTAFARPEDKAHVLEAGFAAHVTKPVEPSELLAVIAALLDRAADRAPTDVGRERST